ncbi:hypothetical protein TMatcc_001412 [Talaromyces marneffei ATCC 18224]
MGILRYGYNLRLLQSPRFEHQLFKLFKHGHLRINTIISTIRRLRKDAGKRLRNLRTSLSQHFRIDRNLSDPLIGQPESGEKAETQDKQDENVGLPHEDNKDENEPQQVETEPQQVESEAQKDDKAGIKPQEGEKIETKLIREDDKITPPQEAATTPQQVESKAQKDDEFEQIDLVADEFIDELETLWPYLLKNFEGQPKISINKLQELGLKFQFFDLNEKISSKEDGYSQFFFPLDCETLNACEPDLSEYSTKKAIEFWYNPREKSSWLWPFPRSAHSIAMNLASLFNVGLRTLHWKNETETKSIQLMDMSTWYPISDRIFSSAGFNAQGPGGWEPSCAISKLDDWSQTNQIWLARNKPHIMINLSHAFDSDDDSIFVVELLVIVALTITRLHKATFPNENVVPVMVFSFTPNNCCRILQAYMDCAQGLVIRKTKFYELDLVNDPYMKAFLRYGACDPRGSTKDLRTPEKWLNLPE